MKIGYKIIIGAISLGALTYPYLITYDKYKNFRSLQDKETVSLLKTFRLRPDTFYTNPSYELGVKSYIDKNIKNIQVDLNAPDVPLKVSGDQTTETGIAVTETAVSNDSFDNTKEKETQAILTQSLQEVKKDKALPKDVVKKETPKKEETSKEKESEKKVVIAGTPIQDKKVDDLQYYIQLGVFNSVENANNLLKKVGGSFVIVKSAVNSKQYIVRSNPGNKEDINTLVDSVKRKDSSLTPIVRVW